VSHPTLFSDPEPPSLSVVRDLHPATTEAFATFWQAYPRRVGKRDAQQAFTPALRRAPSLDAMLHTIGLWLPEWLARPQFTPYPATWLRRDGWDDEPPVRHVTERRLSTREAAFAAVARRKGVM